MSDFINGGGSISHEAATKINRLILKVEGLAKQVADLEHRRTPKQEKRKTLGEIAYDAYLGHNGTEKQSCKVAAKAVCEAIIERHIDADEYLMINSHQLAAAIRKEFEE